MVSSIVFSCPYGALTLEATLAPEMFAGKMARAGGAQTGKFRTKYGFSRTKCVSVGDLTGILS
jgi:hypothetical protein